jgi:hypothetical protein
MESDRAFATMSRSRVHFDLVDKHPPKYKHMAGEMAISVGAASPRIEMGRENF